MSDALVIFDRIITHLPTIKQAMGKEWPAFAEKMREWAGLFEQPADEATLNRNAEKFYGLFMENETARTIIQSRPITPDDPQGKPDLLGQELADADRETSAPEDPRRKPDLDPQKPPEKLETTANRFYLLCQDPDNPDRAKAIQSDDEADTSLPEKQDA